jgi:hypothetical protein
MTLKEAASENKRRGRPKLFPDEFINGMRGLWPEVKTRRGIIDISYRNRAFVILEDDKKYSWLCSEDDFKSSILTELGRIQDKKSIKRVALQICEIKPKTKHAVAMIRQARTGREPDPDASQLIREIIKIINDYTIRHPSVSDAFFN